MTEEHIVIVGNGVAGVTAARHIRKQSDKRITIVSSENEYFFSRTALMYVFMGHMKFEHIKPYEDFFWKKNRIELKQGLVQSVDYYNKILLLENEEDFSYDKLILAVGSTPNKFGWPGQDLKAVQGLYHKQDLEGMEYYAPTTKRAVIVGGGLIGVEMAEMFLSRNIPVTMLVREQLFWNNVLPDEESALVTRHIKAHHVDLQLGTELAEILSDENGRAKAVVTSKGEIISCEFVGLTAGVRPNVGFLKGGGLAIDRGILVDRYLRTNQTDVYALGDCAQLKDTREGRKSLEQVWYTGKIMGEALASTICGKETVYHPGHWYNSAKFFDIEYQTYGRVLSKRPKNQSDFYWEHEDGKICMHFVFEKESNEFIGVNTFGIRLRHELFDRWLTEKKTMEYVLEQLKDANFDPEFYKKYEEQIVSEYNKAFSRTVKVKAKSWKRIFNLM